MKAKNIMMSILLAMGFIAAKAATGYPPELALVSQPVLVYNYNSITVYYDVQNIGDYTYRGDICLYLSPDNGYCYAEKYVKVCPGRIKRVAIEIPAYRPNPSWTYTIMPYYELGDELYSFTTFEYFEPLSFYWDGPRCEPWVMAYAPPRVRYYHRPGDYRYYYDGFRPPMPPPAAGPGMPPPMNPVHHTYNYHHNNGGYPGSPNWNNDNPPAPNNGGNGEVPKATVRPNSTSGSMSHGNSNSGNNAGTSGSNSNGNVNPPAPNHNNSSGTNGSNSGRPSNSGNASRPSSNTNHNSGTTNSGRTGNSGNVSRPSSNTNHNSGTTNSGSNSGRTGNSSNVSRPSSNTSSGTSNSGSNSRSGGSSSSSNSSRGSSSGSRR